MLWILSYSKEVDNLAKRSFGLMLRFCNEKYYDEDDGLDPNLDDVKSLSKLLHLSRQYPKLSNEIYALVFKQLFGFMFHFLIPKLPRPNDETNDYLRNKLTAIEDNWFKMRCLEHKNDYHYLG